MGDLHGTLGLYEVRAGNHKFLATDLARTLDNIVHVVVVDLLAMIVSSEDRVTQVDADLECALVRLDVVITQGTHIDIS